MTPKKKAEELVDKFINTFYKTQDFVWKSTAKQCALIAVDEVLDLNLGLSNCDENNWDIDKFYLEVKQEIEKL